MIASNQAILPIGWVGLSAARLSQASLGLLLEERNLSVAQPTLEWANHIMGGALRQGRAWVDGSRQKAWGGFKSRDPSSWDCSHCAPFRWTVF